MEVKNLIKRINRMRTMWRIKRSNPMTVNEYLDYGKKYAKVMGLIMNRIEILSK